MTELRCELEEDARAALSAVQAHTVTAGKSDETATALADNTTFASESLAPESSKSSTVKVKKKGKPKLTPKEKKERNVRGLYSELPAARAYPCRIPEGDRQSHLVTSARISRKRSCEWLSNASSSHLIQ